jgi:hypothetical protein
LDSSGDQTLGQRPNLCEELCACDVIPGVTVLNREERVIWCRCRPFDQQIGYIRIRICRNDGGCIELVHGNSFDTWRAVVNAGTAAYVEPNSLRLTG